MFDKLPVDIQKNIVSSCTPADLCALERTSKSIKSNINEHGFWKLTDELRFAYRLNKIINETLNRIEADAKCNSASLTGRAIQYLYSYLFKDKSADLFKDKSAEIAKAFKSFVGTQQFLNEITLAKFLIQIYDTDLVSKPNRLKSSTKQLALFDEFKTILMNHFKITITDFDKQHVCVNIHKQNMTFVEPDIYSTEIFITKLKEKVEEYEQNNLTSQRGNGPAI